MLIFDHSGAPLGLFKRFHDECGVDTFIEGGTYHGDTAHQAATLFPHVFTIEKAVFYYQYAKNRADAAPIEFLHGDTREHLPALLTRPSPSVFWLDAHWSGGETAGEKDECPLLAEIALIAASGVPHYVLIDDARFYLSPPPSPHDPQQWPTISEVIRSLSALAGNPYIVVFKDVIIAVPATAREIVTDHCRHAYAGGVSFPGYERPPFSIRVANRVKRLLSKPT